MLPEKGVGHGRQEKRERETSVVLEWEAIGQPKLESVKRKTSFYSIIQTTITVNWIPHFIVALTDDLSFLEVILLLFFTY